MNKISVLLAGLLVSLSVLGTAAAEEKAAALQLEITGSVEARIRSDIESVTTKTFVDAKDWSLESADAVRAKLKPVVRDCFTEDCLKSAGGSLGLRTGFTAKFSGESQIYEWTLTMYDLRTGSVLNSVKGNCELCGQAEVSKTYARSLTNLLNATKVPDKIVAAAQPGTPDSSGLTGKTGPQTVRLRVSVVPAETEIYLGDALVGQGDATIPVGAGRHELRFSREGYRGLQETILVNENSPESILLRVHLSETPAAPSVVQGGGDGPIDRMGADSRTLWGWVGVGSGAALLTTGIVLAAIDGDSTCDGIPYSRCPEIRSTAGGAVVTSVLGGVLLASGVGLLTWELLSGNSSSSSESKPDRPRRSRAGEGTSGVRLAPSVGLDSAGVQLLGRF